MDGERLGWMKGWSITDEEIDGWMDRWEKTGDERSRRGTSGGGRYAEADRQGGGTYKARAVMSDCLSLVPAL